ncbi:hypothetical protein PHMEG_00021077 [Phytophthora megakarya]|uniref:Uncharacterized protein n=1 Tax=Phytophthora megakarya TaxID=4795 RepID=A0A225VML9_9STRA|nr:hypothetical protein PHMEG_00021077 [Phytophthora megakarya]
MARLSLRPYPNLLPEQVGGEFDHPFYARVVGWTKKKCSLKGKILRNVAAEFVVTAREVNTTGQLSFLRRPVSVKVNNKISYGQVVAVDRERITIISAGGEIFTTVSDIAPRSNGEIADIQTGILDRVLGRNGETATNDIMAVLDGLMSSDSFPLPGQLCAWIDPQTGESSEISLQHGLAFAYFVDGDRCSVPATVIQSLFDYQFALLSGNTRSS